MKITRDERMHLNRLSLELLGSSSKWHKIMMEGEKRANTDGTEGYHYEYPSLEEVRASLEERAKEKAEKAKKDESK